MRFDLVRRVLPRSGRRTTEDFDPPLIPLAGGEEVNQVVLSGVIAAEPVRETGHKGDPITVLLLSFTAADERARAARRCCEIEVADRIAERHRHALCPGRRVWVAGQLNGDGVWATALGT